jgi:ribonuclease HI
MTDEWPYPLAPGDYCFRRKFLVELPPKSSWLSQETILYTDGSLCEGRAGAGVFSDTLREFYALCSLATGFQTEEYVIFACSDYAVGANMHNMTICICSDSKAALLALSSYTISSDLLYQCWLSLQDLSNNKSLNRAKLFWVPCHCDIKGNEEADRLARMGLHSHLCSTVSFNCPGYE